MDFEPGVIRSRNEQMRREVWSLRLQERLRNNCNPDVSRLGVAPVRKAVLAFILVAVAIGGLLAVAHPASASTTFVVNSTGDENDADFPAGNFDGPSDGKCDVTAFTPGEQCNLRAAIQEASRTTDQDTVNFNIPGSGVKTIAVGTPGYGIGNAHLPVITQPLIIDGYTQPGSKKYDAAMGTNAILRVQIGDGDVGLGGSVVRGLVINGFNPGVGASGGPVLASASISSRRTSARGTLDSTTFLIRLFSDKDTDEGKNYIGQKRVATDGTGHAGFTFTTREGDSS